MLGFRGISKAFGGIRALRDVGFDVAPGEIHAVVGANGAGKSTLLRILSGLVEPDAGDVLLDGRAVRIRSPHHAHRLGIGLVPQETTLCENLSIAENVFLGKPWWLRPRALAEEARGRLREVGLDTDPADPAGRLSVAQKQLVQIARALADRPRVLALDEPTSSLSEAEVARLFAVLRGLRAGGVTLFFVSHRLREIQEIADRATVLRDGAFVATVDAKSTPREELVRHMAGLRPEQALGATASQAGREVEVARGGGTATSVQALGARHLSGAGFSDVSFSVRRGEILGWFGLVGAGRSETARALFGVEPATSGELVMDGVPVPVRSPSEAIGRGIALVPEDRKLQGLILKLRLAPNVSLATLGSISRGGWVSAREERERVGGHIERLRIRCSGPEQPAGELSGGNQQKAVLAKWLDTSPRVLILDEPTKGVDLAAKAEIHGLVRDLAAQGAGVILISSELEEVRAMSDRVLVFRAGRLNGEFAGREATDQALMSAAT